MSFNFYKHLHTSFAALSIIFFVIRAYWSVMECGCLQNRWVRIAPHVIDTLFLLTGLAMALAIGFGHPWLIAKIIGLIAYIFVGIYAIRKGKTRTSRLVAAIIAILIYLYIVQIALNKSHASYFA